MPIKFHCECGQEYSAADAMAGKKMKCRSCGDTATIPQPVPQTGDDDPLEDVWNDSDWSGSEQDGGAAGTCPECQAEMGSSAVLCVSCGYHQTLKRKLRGAAAAPAGEGTPFSAGSTTSPPPRRGLLLTLVPLILAAVATGVTWLLTQSPLLTGVVGLAGLFVTIVIRQWWLYGRDYGMEHMVEGGGEGFGGCSGGNSFGGCSGCGGGGCGSGCGGGGCGGGGDGG